MFKNRGVMVEISPSCFITKTTGITLVLSALVIICYAGIGLGAEAEKYQLSSFDVNASTDNNKTSSTFAEPDQKSVVHDNTDTTAANYLSYQDPLSGFRLQYPSNWIKVEAGNHVEFQPPSISKSPSSASPLSSMNDSFSSGRNSSNGTGKLIAFEIRVDGILPFGLDSLEKYTRFKILPQRQIGEFKIIELNVTNIGGNPAYKVIYTNIFHKTGVVLKTMEITTVRDNIGYDIRYFTDPAIDYSKYLSEARKIIDSFQFIPLTAK
jgi:hypothetical protein